MKGTPSGTYAFFATSSCPDGWVVANGTDGTLDLRGEFIRGWDQGAGRDPGRGLRSWQNDSYEQHNHGATGVVTAYHRRSNHKIANYRYALWNQGMPTAVYTTYSHNRGESETRPRNVAMQVCMAQ